MAENLNDKLHLHKAVAALLGRVQELGPVELKFSRDVGDLEAAHREIGKGETGEHFRRAMDTLPPNRFFWLGAYLEGNVISTVAARFDDVSWPLQLFVKHYWERTFEGEGGVAVQIAEGSPKVAQPYTGRFAYLGEGVTREDYRNNHLSYVLVRLGLLFAFDEWSPTIAYGWMRDWHAYRGLSVRWGFNGCDASAFEWINPPAKTDWHNLAFLRCDREGFRQLLRNPAPDALFAARKNSPAKSGCRRPSGSEE